MKRFWEVTKTVFALMGATALTIGLTVLVVVMGRRRNETTLAGVPADPMADPGVVAALDAGRERMAALFERIRMGGARGSSVGGDGADGKGGS